MAAIAAPSACGPVRLRNLSTRGGLIETAAPPKVGDSFLLRRADQSVVGTIVWCRGNRAGLQFDTAIAIADWLPVEHQGQQAVDAIFHRFTSGSRGLMQVAPATTWAADSQELCELASSLEELGDSLAEDADAIARHGTQLQALDIAVQMLRKLAAASD